MSVITIVEIIDKAIQREIEAYEFYTSLSKKVNEKDAKDTLKYLASEEVKHKEFLQSYKDGKYDKNALKTSEVVDYKIAEFLDIPDIDKDPQTKDIYLIAAHRELNSYKFYIKLSELQPDGEVKQILVKMANEELKHKEKVEYLYSNTAFGQTQGG